MPHPLPQFKHSALVSEHDRLDRALGLLEERRSLLMAFHDLPASQVGSDMSNDSCPSTIESEYELGEVCLTSILWMPGPSLG